MTDQKLFFSIALMLSLMFLFSACGSDKESSETHTTAKQTVISTVTQTELASTQTATQGDTTVTEAVTSDAIKYTDYTKYIGKKYSDITAEFGNDFTTEDCVSTIVYIFDDVGFHFDNLDEATDQMVVRMARVYGDNYVSRTLRANMTLDELKKAVGDKTQVNAPEQYSDTMYRVAINYKGTNYGFMFDGNPENKNNSALYVDISK